ncbi:MAG: flagellar basal-body MS-ring/collar protein FliF, partial [Oscillospiraceae bacterium]
MNEQLEKILATYNTFWEKQSKNSKLTYIGSFIGIVVVAIIITIMLNKTDYALLYQNLESNEASQIIGVIQEMGIDVKVEKNGTIFVPKKQVDTLKLQLASQGFPKSALNYNTFKDNVDFMTTEYEKRLYRVYELQDRMASTIQAIQGVKKAYVNITVPEDKDVVLVQNREPAKASVQLELSVGVQLTAQQVTSIKELVAGGVPGLEPAKVSVSDTQGNQLSSGDDSLTDSSQSSSMIDFQRQLEQRYEDKVLNQFGPVFGNNKIRVTSTVIVDYGNKKTQDT